MSEPVQTERKNGLPERVDVAIIGAGPGGITAAIKLLEAGIDDFVILEREDQAGGTWHNNQYPGLSCDVPSHLYSFSFEPKRDWSRPFASRAEIHPYMQHCVDKYGVGPHIRFGAGVIAASWDDAAHEWTLTLTDERTVTCKILISALGMYNQARMPDIAGRDSFQGESWHTARWPSGADLTGKTIAVIGSAASAVQLVPEVAKVAGRLHVFQRTANWVMPKDDTPYGADELEEMRRDGSIAAQLRADALAGAEIMSTWDDPDLLGNLRSGALENLDSVKDPEIRDRLRPQLPLGSQRPLFSNEFYPTFNRDNVELVTEAIAKITPTGVQTVDGTERKADVIIYATGFAANRFLSVIDVTGRNGLHIESAWGDGPQAYFGVTTSGFPNLFMLYGPNTNNGCILSLIELQVEYIVKKIRYMRRENIAWIDVRQDVHDRYNETMQTEIQNVEVWRTVGSRYYRAASGRNVTQWPHTMAVYKERIRREDNDAYEAHRATEDILDAAHSHSN